MPMIVWGKKRREYDKGLVAEWCSQCYDVKVFAVRAVNMVSHVYFIPLGAGKIVGYLAKCESCSLEIAVEIEDYGTPVLDDSADLEEVIRRTNPNILARVAERLALEKKLEDSPGDLTPEERLAVIGSRLAGAAVLVEGRCRDGGNLGLVTGGALAATFIVPLILGIWLTNIDKDLGALVWQIPVAAFVLGIAVTIYLGATAVGRWIRKEIVPSLAESLAPLKPTHDEIDGVLVEMREADLKIGKKLTAHQIIDAINEMRGGPGRAAMSG